jgi:hypothetical protein
MIQAWKSLPGDSAKGYAEGVVRHEEQSEQRIFLAVSTSVYSFSLAFWVGKDCLTNDVG